MAYEALVRIFDGGAVFAGGPEENGFPALLSGSQLTIGQTVAVGAQRDGLDVAHQVFQVFPAEALGPEEKLFGADPAFGLKIGIAAVPFEGRRVGYVFEEAVVDDIDPEAV